MSSLVRMTFVLCFIMMVNGLWWLTSSGSNLFVISNGAHGSTGMFIANDHHWINLTIDKKSVSAPADIKVMIDFLTTEVNTQNLDDLGKLVLDGALMHRLKILLIHPTEGMIELMISTFENCREVL